MSLGWKRNHVLLGGLFQNLVNPFLRLLDPLGEFRTLGDLGLLLFGGPIVPHRVLSGGSLLDRSSFNQGGRLFLLRFHEAFGVALLILVSHAGVILGTGRP